MATMFKIAGVAGDLEVFEDKLTITPRGLLGVLNKGLKGTKTIPFASITAIQHKQPGLTSGYLQFTVPGGLESKRGVFDAAKDENTFMFTSKVRAAVDQAKNYIENQMKDRPTSKPVNADAGVDLSAQLARLADLHKQGAINDEEFAGAKRKLLGL